MQGWNTVQHRWIGHLQHQNRLDVLKELMQRRSEAAINQESLPRSPNVYVCDSSVGLRSIKQWAEGERKETLTWSNETTNTCRCTTPAAARSSAFTHSLLVPFGRWALLLLTQNTLHIKSLGGSLSTFLLATRGRTENKLHLRSIDILARFTTCPKRPPFFF